MERSRAGSSVVSREDTHSYCRTVHCAFPFASSSIDRAGALIGTAHTVRNAIILDGAASAPPPIAVRRTAAHLLRHAILLDFQCAFASDSGGAKPSKWRPATAAAFAKRWEKLCTRANGRPRFHGLIEAPRDTSP